MNATPLSALAVASAQPLDTEPGQQLSAKAAAHAWRGRCIAEFARAEMVVTRALFALASPDKRLGECHFVGTRFETLEQLLHVRGGDAANAYKAVKSFRPWHQLRAYLCHGEATVTGSTAETWSATFRLVSFAGDRIKHDVMILTAAQAELERRALQRDSNSLVSLVQPYCGPDTVFERITISGSISR